MSESQLTSGPIEAETHGLEGPSPPVSRPRRAGEPSKAEPLGKRVRDWTGFALGLMGGVLGLLGFLEARKAQTESRIATSLARQIEVKQILAKSWDLMGGHPGTTTIADYASRSQLELARREIEKALLLEADSSNAHYIKGVYHLGKGQAVEAIEEFRTVISSEPEHASAHTSLGNVLRRQGKLEEAVDAYRAAVQINPGAAAHHYNLGLVLHQQRKIEDAIEAFRAAIQLDSDLALAHLNLGNALYQKGKLEAAVDAYRIAIQIHPGNGVFYENLGLVLAQQGKHGEAQQAFDRARELGARVD